MIKPSLRIKYSILIIYFRMIRYRVMSTLENKPLGCLIVEVPDFSSQ